MHRAIDRGCSGSRRCESHRRLPGIDGEPPPDACSPPSDAAAAAPDAARCLAVVEVRDLDWQAVRNAVDPAAIRARMRAIVERMEALLDRAGGPGMLFDGDRADAADRAIRVLAMDAASPLWIVGDLHGDLLALEAALAVMRDPASQTGDEPSRGSSFSATSSTMRGSGSKSCCACSS